MKQMTFKTKRSNSMIGKTDAKKKQVHGEPSPDEAPALATKRCCYGCPAPVVRHELLFLHDGSEL